MCKERSLKPILVMVVIFAMTAMTGCVEPLDQEAFKRDAKELKIRLYMPGSMPASKENPGAVESVDPESKIYTVQVWMFEHVPAGDLAGNDQTAVAYSEIQDIWTNRQNLPDGSIYGSEFWEVLYTYEMSLVVPKTYLDSHTPDQMRVDFYILANGPSIGSPAAKTMTRGQLRALTFASSGESADWFGSAAPMVGKTPAEAIGANGLPIVGFFNTDKEGRAEGVDISFLKTALDPAAETPQQMPVIQLERAVSKIRFVFAKPEDCVDSGARISKIVINGELIPLAGSIPVFPREDGSETAPDPTSSGSAYAGAAQAVIAAPGENPLIAETQILTLLDPSVLSPVSAVVSSGQTKAPQNMSEQEYQLFLTETIGETTTTERSIYLRESGKKISGTIYYRYSDEDTEDREVNFYMAADDAETLFLRNSAWTVYAYFSSPLDHELKVNVTRALPWTKNEQVIDYQQNTVATGGDGKFTVDRFTAIIEKVRVDDIDQYNVRFDGSKVIKGYLHILSPVGATLIISKEGDGEFFNVTPTRTDITGRQLVIEITPRTPEGNPDPDGKWMMLSFAVESGGGRLIGGNSELKDSDKRYVFWR
jgi:hypothetical protein